MVELKLDDNTTGPPEVSRNKDDLIENPFIKVKLYVRNAGVLGP